VVGSVHVASQLGPGIVDSAVITFRLDVPRALPEVDDRISLLNGVLIELEHVLAMPLADVARAYAARCGFSGQPVRISLLPRGTKRGVARSIDEIGAFRLESASGRIATVGVDQIRQISLAPDVSAGERLT
jgi:hypothetical protein